VFGLQANFAESPAVIFPKLSANIVPTCACRYRKRQDPEISSSFLADTAQHLVTSAFGHVLEQHQTVSRNPSAALPLVHPLIAKAALQIAKSPVPLKTKPAQNLSSTRNEYTPALARL